jgi:hypothetical protein
MRNVWQRISSSLSTPKAKTKPCLLPLPSWSSSPVVPTTKTSVRNQDRRVAIKYLFFEMLDATDLGEDVENGENDTEG